MRLRWWRRTINGFLIKRVSLSASQGLCVLLWCGAVLFSLLLRFGCCFYLFCVLQRLLRRFFYCIVFSGLVLLWQLYCAEMSDFTMCNSLTMLRHSLKTIGHFTLLCFVYFNYTLAVVLCSAKQLCFDVVTICDANETATFLCCDGCVDTINLGYP